MDASLENWLKQEFSTTESAEILQMPASTFRSYLQREKSLRSAFLPDQEEGGWRRLTPDAILNIGVLQALLEEGLDIKTAARIVTAARSSMFDGKTVLVVDFNKSNEVSEYLLADRNEFVAHWADFINAAHKRMVGINISEIKTTLQKRINEFPGRE